MQISECHYNQILFKLRNRDPKKDTAYLLCDIGIEAFFAHFARGFIIARVGSIADLRKTNKLSTVIPAFAGMTVNNKRKNPLIMTSFFTKSDIINPAPPGQASNQSDFSKLIFTKARQGIHFFRKGQAMNISRKRASQAAWAILLTSVAVFATGAGLKYGQRITTEKLGGKERYLAYASTDKPIYREGETVYLRVVVLDAASNIPVKNGNMYATVKIGGPKGDIVFQGAGQGADSSAGLLWKIPPGQAGGCYTATVACPSLGAPETERKFEIRAYRPPRLKTQIEFLRKGYGSGDEVSATVKVTRAEGGIPSGAKVTAIARVDGAEVFSKSGLSVSTDGNCTAAFSLPAEISVGDGTLSFIIEDGGVVETASKTIPILLQTLDLAFYPEGGDLVAGLPCRVYVEAKRPDGKPADLEGRIVQLSADGKPGETVIAELRTVHEGRGLLQFKPEAKVAYALVLDKPAGIARTFALPEVKASGAALRSLQEVYPYEGGIALKVTSTPDSAAAKVVICKREVELDAKEITAGKEASVTLDPKDAEGVLMVTVLAQDGQPLAERLVYRRPKFAVNVKITPEKAPFIPGGKVKLNIETTDENGRPVEAVVGLTVTDDAVLEMIEKREQAPRLPVMVYLENEVRELADALVYLDPNAAEAPTALDLLLGTQGWRRFILVRYDEIKKEMSAPAMRVLAERVIVTVPCAVERGAGAFVLGMEKKKLAKGAEVDALADAKNEGAEMPEEVAEALEDDDEKPAVAPQGKDKASEMALVPAKEEAKEARRAFKVFAEVKADMEAPMREMVAIREYAHQVRDNRKPNDRVDFTETLYWNAGIRTGARDGKATVEFGLSDSVTTFRVIADAFGNNGALGCGDSVIESVEPFYLEPKMPLEITAGDVIELPVALVNSTVEKFDAVNLAVRGEGLDIITPVAATLDANTRGRAMVKISAQKAGVYQLVISAAAGGYTDTVTRTLTVKPKGFPVSIHHGGLVGADSPVNTVVTIPATVEPGSMVTVARVYPTPLASMEEALNALLREPCGCFEQTSSSNYPLVMAQQYFTTHQGIDPAKIARARDLLEKGYKKLTGFECKQKGYEWFGGDPGHEALTAYGLMEFVDMGKVMEMDSGMLERTRQWLLARRDGKGGFMRNDRALDSFGRAPVPTTNAYVVWALIEAGQDPKTLEKEIAAIREEAEKTQDTYVIALAANILYKIGDAAPGRKLAAKLKDAVEKDGSVGGAKSTITCSGGDALRIETTSLAILAWLKDDATWADQVELSMKWLFELCKSGRFGSTQSTILALKAINAYDQARAKPKESGAVQLLLDGKPFGKPAPFDPETKGAIELPDFSAAMTPGEHKLELVMEKGSKMPFSVEVTCNTPLPATSKECELKLQTALSAATIREGEPLELVATVTAGEKIAPTPIAIIGLPGGLEPRHDQLKELVKAGRIDSYEVLGREVVLYWRALKAGENRIVPLSLTAAIPGSYTAPASRTYLYYTDEHKQWVAGHAVTVTPR
jgi:hypothetical protein